MNLSVVMEIKKLYDPQYKSTNSETFHKYKKCLEQEILIECSNNDDSHLN